MTPSSVTFSKAKILLIVTFLSWGPAFAPTTIRFVDAHPRELAPGARLETGAAAARAGRAAVCCRGRPTARRRPGPGRVVRGARRPPPAGDVPARGSRSRARVRAAHQDLGDARLAPPAHARRRRRVPGARHGPAAV